ncbi:MAG TPA: STAS domain-containing protein [Actinomycetota bacterium]|nr:STAS domain-containing protein [Actinomycetota bacterium]
MAIENELRIESLDAPRHLKVVGDLDLASAPLLESSLEPLLKEAGDLTLDASGMTFIDSSGIRALIRASLRLGDARLIILKPSAQLKRLFTITGIQQGERIDLRNDDCCSHRAR